MLKSSKSLLSYLLGFKKSLLNRPRGLKRLGEGSWMIRPWRLGGKHHIEIGSRCSILSGATIWAFEGYEGQKYNPRVSLGDDVYVGRRVYLTAVDDIDIGDGCVLSEDVFISDLSHGLEPHGGLIMRQALRSKGPVRIGPNCFLGYRAVVMPGVTLGEWCVVGANSVVTRSFPSYSMVAGVPARLIKVYSLDLQGWVEPSIFETKQDPT